MGGGDVSVEVHEDRTGLHLLSILTCWALTRIGAIAYGFLSDSNGLSTDARKNSLRTRLLRVEIRGF